MNSRSLAAIVLAALLSACTNTETSTPGGFALAGTLQLLKQRGLLTPPEDARHVFVVSNDGIPEELQEITAGNIDATVSQPADLYAKFAPSYLKAALEGKTFQPGPTEHQSTIIQVRSGVLEDQLSAPAGDPRRRRLRRCGEHETR